MDAAFTSHEAALLRQAQSLFILSQLLNFPLYYLPGLRGLFGGDGKGETKFPCSISWMTRKGAPRLTTLLLWNVGWACMLAAVVGRALESMTLGDALKAILGVQMFATGFVTVVLTPMRGRDVALGTADALHCYTAMVYVFDHVLANEFLLGVSSLFNPYGLGFLMTSGLCGVCQFLRAWDDKYAKRLFVRTLARSQVLSFDTFVWCLEAGFMLFENALFIIFLFGMTSGISIVDDP
mmetsp:Transcript_31339/g.81868  ORF Transcript_31339/g.81868 Transcript_31339/m.81868 type:complete len:237 (-) Transcript_31339:266-976(-)